MTESTGQPSPRQSIPKKVRFEVFKRDSFKCQYCGASAPEVLLQIDHIKAVADGGDNDITNLVTACAACNLGKSKRALDDRSAVTRKKLQLDDLQERRDQLEMMMEWMEGLKGLKSQAIDKLAKYWTDLAPGFAPNDRGRQQLRRWLARYSPEDIMKAMDTASAQYLEIKDDGRVTQESWELAFGKIAPILSVERDAKDDPDLKELLYIRGIVRNRCSGYFKNDVALDWLRAARSWGISMTELRQMAYGVRNWSDFDRQIDRLIEQYQAARGE